MIWVCILCRKKQELLSKTGQWINAGLGGQHDVIMSRIQADLNQQQFPQFVNETTDKRPKLERAHSAAEKENLPLQRSNSQLRRQYSQQESGTRGTSGSYSQPEPMTRTGGSGYSFHDVPDDPQYYRAELDDLMRSTPYYPPDGSKKHKRTGSVKRQQQQQQQQQQRSFSSSEDDLRSTSGEDVDRDSEKGEFVFIYSFRHSGRQKKKTKKLTWVKNYLIFSCFYLCPVQSMNLHFNTAFGCVS